MYASFFMKTNPLTPLGTLISGSLADGFTMRINPEIVISSIKTGKFVSIAGHHYRFFSLITDMHLEHTYPEIAHQPPGKPGSLLHTLAQRHYLYATARLRPMTMLDAQMRKWPVKTVPDHFAPVHEVTPGEITAIFGSEIDEPATYFSIGTPLEMDVSVCLHLPHFLERSNGIFGKTGTGKTFLTRLVLAGIISNTTAVTLIFDMHSEYGLQARKEGNHEQFVKGLKTLFPSKMAIFSLDPTSTRRRGGSPDVTIRLSYKSVEVDDIISLQHELNLHPTACEAAYLIAARYKQEWLSTLLQSTEKLRELAAEVGAHPESIVALHRKLQPIKRLPFFDATLEHDTVIDDMLEYLQRGISIIIEFGNFTSTFCYLLLANIITRRIHTRYIAQTEKFLGSHKASDEPRKLMITIEEAHKFLNPLTASQTIFGIIAREMRKYYVSLLVIDQRPSGIDPEIVSQLGTKIVAALHDEKDIQAVLTGTAHAQELRTVLASLESKKQVLLLGHAVPMPIVIHTRAYDENFYRAMAQQPSMQIISATELY